MMSISSLLLSGLSVDPRLASVFNHDLTKNDVVRNRDVEPSKDKPDSSSIDAVHEKTEKDRKVISRYDRSSATGKTNKISKKRVGEPLERQERTIFVGNLPKEVTLTKNLRRLKRNFSQFGEIESLRFRSLPRDVSQSFKKAVMKKIFQKNVDNVNAYVVYKDKDSAHKALESNGQILFDRHIRVDKAISTDKSTRNSVFVGGLPFSVNEEALYNLFCPLGEISYVRVPRDRLTKAGRGIAYVCFKKRAEALAATKFDGTKFENHEIRVVTSRNRNICNALKRHNNSKKHNKSPFNSVKNTNKKISVAVMEGRRAKNSKILTRKIVKTAKRITKNTKKSKA